MTPDQRTRLREILTAVQASGIAFAYQKSRTVPEYSVDRALEEIEAILNEPAGDNVDWSVME